MLLLLTLAAIWLGLLASNPGLAILACILALPALIRTAMVVRRRSDVGRAVSTGEKFALFAGSFVVSAVVLVVTAVASVGTFCAVCLGLYSASGGRGSAEESLIVVSGFMAVAATGTVLWLLAKWVRSRYRRDVGD